MSFKIVSREKDGDSFEVFLQSVLTESEQAERDMLKEAGEQVREYVVANLNKHRRVLANRYKGRPAMADDVKISTRKDRNGNIAVRVQGGKMTGTLWHLVNDGNLHSTGTHFMDGALARLDGTIEQLWNRILR